MQPECKCIEYELCGDPPDFSAYTYGTKYSIVLRNTATGELEEFEFVISGDDGDFFPNTRTLPVIAISKALEIARKIIERHRRYIIAATEILDGDYPHLAEYCSHS